MKKVMRKRRKGFTLIELIVVIAIIAVLAAIAVPRFADLTGTADDAQLEANARVVLTAVHMYQSANDGAFPSADGDITPYLPDGIPSNISVDYANRDVENSSGSALLSY